MLIHRAYLRLWEKKISPGVRTQRHILGGSYVGAIERGKATVAVLCHTAVQAPAVCGEWRLLPSCRAQASLRGGLPRCRAQAPACAGFSICGAWAQHLQQVDSRAEAQQQWHTGLVAPRPAGSSRTRDGTRVPCLGRRILYPWATREAQQDVFFFFFFLHSGLPMLEKDCLLYSP